MATQNRMKQVLLIFLTLWTQAVCGQKASVYNGAEHEDSICTIEFDSTALFIVSITKYQIYYENQGDTLLDADIYEFDSLRKVVIWYGYPDREFQIYGFSNFMIDSISGLSIELDMHRDTEIWFHISRERDLYHSSFSKSQFPLENMSLNKSVYKRSRLVYVSVSE